VRALPAVVLLVEVLVFFRGPLVDARYAIPWDLRSYHLPIASFVAESLGGGELPLWDPWTYCGRPLYANLTAQLFYPPAWPAFGLANVLGIDSMLDLLEWQIALHVWAGGLLCYWLLRRLDLSRAPALAGATIFQLGGYFASQAQHLGAMNAAAWLPLSWLAVWEMRRRSRARWFAALAVSFAMSALAGFPAVTAVAAASSILLAIAIAPGWRAPLRVVAAGAWSALLAAVQLLPSMELTAQSVARYRADFFTGSAMPPAALLSLVRPNWHGVFDMATFRGPGEPTFLYVYCGLPALALVAMAVIASPVARRFAFVGLACAMWMTGAFDRLTPGAIAASTYPEFALAGFTLAVAAVAAFGAEALSARSPRWVPAALVAVIAADLTIAGSGRPMNRGSLEAEPGVTSRHFDGSERVLEAVRGLTRRSAPPSRIDTIDDSMAWAMAAPLIRIPTAGGNDPFALESIMRLRLPMTGGHRWGRYYQIARPDLDLLGSWNVRYLLSRRPVEVAGMREAMELPGRFVYENPRVAPRFTLDGGTVRVLRYSSREVALETDAPLAAALATSETYYPGWRAWVDGVETPLRTVGGAFRALSVPAGRRQVVMRFEPRILWYGAAVTLLSALSLVALVRFRDN
jgi:hypothetical protein